MRLGVSDATLRDWAARGLLKPTNTAKGPMPMDGWIAPRRQPLVHVERSRGYVAHVWVGWLGVHLAWPLWLSRFDFCADWWR